jgi:hypothetical protein
MRAGSPVILSKRGTPTVRISMSRCLSRAEMMVAAGSEESGAGTLLIALARGVVVMERAPDWNFFQ